MSKKLRPKLIGVFPVYDDYGIPMALIHCYDGQQEKCRRRAVQVGKTIAAFNGEKWLDNTKGQRPEIFNLISKHVNVIMPNFRQGGNE